MPPLATAPAPAPGSAPTAAESLPDRIRRQAGPLLLGCLCLAATNALGLYIPRLLQHAIDALRSLGGGAAAPALGAAERAVAVDAALIAGAACAQAVIRTFSRTFIFNAGRNIEYGLRSDLFAHLCRMDPGFYRRHSTGDVMSRLTNDLSAVRMLFGPGILNIVNTALVYGVGIWLMVAISPRLTLMALVPYPLLIVGARLWSRRIYAASRTLQDQLGTLSTTLHEDLAGMAVVKLYALEDRRHAALAAQSRAYLDGALALARARGSLMPLFAVLGTVGTLVVLWLGGREVIAGRMSLGELVAFNAYLVFLSWPTLALGWILAVWQRGLAAWSRVRDLLEANAEIADAPGAAAPPGGIRPEIEIRDLTVRRDGRTLLDRISVTIPAGGTLAIVGPTGSGKTTLVDAIPRFVDAPRGTVFVGGRDVHDVPLAALRSLVGYAPQEPFLFSATVAENIGFGIPPGVPAAERDRRITRAAESAGLTPDLAVLPEGLDTVVGERGITLSGGQRQRVALARALAAEPAVLILDDSLSSVDAQTERDILGRIGPILGARTSILVSHRVAAVRGAGEILVLGEGRVVERGTHGDLLAAGGLYASLYREQLAAEALGAGP